MRIMLYTVYQWTSDCLDILVGAEKRQTSSSETIFSDYAYNIVIV